MNIKQQQYNLKDSGLNFIYAILIPQIVAIVLVIIAMSVTGSDASVGYEELIGKGLAYYIFLSAAQLTFFAIFVLYNNNKKIAWQTATKIKNKINLKQALIIALIVIVSLFFLSPIIDLVNHLFTFVGYNPSESLGIDLSNLYRFIAAVIALAVLPAICEELLFRGIIYNGLLKLGVKKAIIFSALIFALMHLSLQQTVYQIILGVILAYAVYVTGSLKASMLLHFLNNFIVLLISYIIIATGTQAQEVVYESVISYISPVMYAIIGVALIYGLFYELKKVSNKQEKILIDINNDKENKNMVLNKMPRDIRKIFVTGALIGILFWALDFVTVVIS